MMNFVWDYKNHFLSESGIWWKTGCNADDGLPSNAHVLRSLEGSLRSGALFTYHFYDILKVVNLETDIIR